MTTTEAVARELDALRALLTARVEHEPFTYFLSSVADRLPYLRTRIDLKLAALGSAYEQDVLGEEDYLGLIADLIEYRIAVFNAPVPFFPAADDYVRGETPNLAAKPSPTEGTVL